MPALPQHVLDGAYDVILERALHLTSPLQPDRTPALVGLMRESDDVFVALVSVPAQRPWTLPVRFSLVADDGSPLSPMHFKSGLEAALAEPPPDAEQGEPGPQPAGRATLPTHVRPTTPPEPALSTHATRTAAPESVFFTLAALRTTPGISETETEHFRRVFPFTTSGFRKTRSGTLRVYLRYHADRTTIAVDLPIAGDGADLARTSGASLMAELAPLLRSGIPPHITEHEVPADRCCGRAFDLAPWFTGSASPRS